MSDFETLLTEVSVTVDDAVAAQPPLPRRP
jgi:hypothetical protein